MKKFLLCTSRTAAIVFGVFISTVLLTTAASAQIIPHLDCVEPILQNGVPNGQLRAHFGYTNTSSAPVTINDGPSNYFSPNPGGIYTNQQTTVFQPGFQRRSFSIVLNNDSATTTWVVQNQSAYASLTWSSFCGTGNITYQGRLSVSGAATNQPHDFQFQFYDSLTGGTATGELFELRNIPVENGIFTVYLNTDLVFRNYTGNAGFLEIRVRKANTGDAYLALAPRQRLAAVPFAFNAKSVSGGKVQIPSNVSTSTNANCSKPSDYGQIVLTNLGLRVCTSSGWKTATLQ